MRILSWLVFVMVIFSPVCHAQTLVLRDSIVLNNSPVSLSADPFGNIYTIEGDGLMHKYDSLGHYVGSAGDRKFSREAIVSAYNPYKIAVFDYNTQEFVLFDHKLALLSRVSFSDISADAAAISKAGSYWVFSRLSQTLLQFDNPLRILLQAKVPEYGGDNDSLRLILQEHDQSLYLFVPGRSIMIFDLWGTFRRQFPTTSHLFALSGQGMWVCEAPSQITLIEYTAPYNSKTYTLVPFSSFSLSGKVLITQDEKKIRFYEIK